MCTWLDNSFTNCLHMDVIHIQSFMDILQIMFWNWYVYVFTKNYNQHIFVLNKLILVFSKLLCFVILIQIVFQNLKPRQWPCIPKAIHEVILHFVNYDSLKRRSLINGLRDLNNILLEFPSYRGNKLSYESIQKTFTWKLYNSKPNLNV